MRDSARRTVFLQEMGLGPLWQRRDHAHVVAVDDSTVETPPGEAAVLQPVTASSMASEIFAHEAPAAIDRETVIADMDWNTLESAVSGCTSCNLCKTRTKTVFGVGDRKARWMFIGEGPGRNEDQQGLPFVGPAGKLLDNMMAAMGLKRGENTYIANIVKCRPTDANKRDRPPEADEAGACMPYLQRQIALIKPTVIVALGKTAALSLLQLDPSTPVSRLRGKVYRHGDIPLIVTYHPAYLLRNMPDKSKAWADLCLAMQAYEGAH